VLLDAVTCSSLFLLGDLCVCGVLLWCALAGLSLMIGGDSGDFGEKSSHPKSLWTNQVFSLLA
jgi:hypothetical protein